MIAATVCGQTTTATYEAASIRANVDGDSRYTFRIENDGTLYATGITLRRLVMTAWNIPGYRITGGPGWLSTSRWDVVAKGSGRAQAQDVRPMLRALLADRFQLRTHSETRKQAIYELAGGRNGPRLLRTEERKMPELRIGNGLIRMSGVTVTTFASQLSYALGRPVVDKTGKAGEFDFDLRWTPAAAEDGGSETYGLPTGTPNGPVSTADGPSLFTAIEEQLGLRLRAARGNVELLVIDGAQVPAPN